MRPHQVADDDEPEPAAAGTAVARLLGPPEPVEHPGQVLDADAGAGHLDHHPLVLAAGGDRDDTPSTGVPHGAADQVVHDLPQPLGIRDRGHVGGVHAQVSARRARLRPVRDRGLLQQVGRTSRTRRLGIAEVPAGRAPQVRTGTTWFTVVGVLEPVPPAPDVERSVLVGWEAARSELGFDGHRPWSA